MQREGRFWHTCCTFHVVRRAADWITPVAGLARVQGPHLIRSLATPATVGTYITAVRLNWSHTGFWIYGAQ